MKIIREETLALYRGSGRCQLCGKACKARECHHVLARGMGGGRRLDVALNLLAVGSFPCCDCHALIHGGGRIERIMCLEAVAAREGTSWESVEEALHVLARLNGKNSQERLLEDVEGLADEEVKRLVLAALKEAKVV